MSRSYAKRSRYFNTSSYHKRLANKIFRRFKGFNINGNKYKRLYCSWMINDGGKSHPIPEANTKENINEKKEWEKEYGTWWAEEARRK